MAGRRARSRLGDTARSAGRVAFAAASLPDRVDSFVAPLLWWVGWCGLAALAAVGVLALLPDETWPAFAERALLPVYAVSALAVASLVGWGCMQKGQDRVRRALGPVAAGILFVALPLGAELLDLLDARGVVAIDAWPQPWLWRAALRFTSGVVVALGLGAFLTWKTRPRRKVRLGRGAWFVLVCAPYVLLVAVVAYGVPAAWVSEPLGDVLEAAGGGTLVLQLALAHFLGGGGE